MVLPMYLMAAFLLLLGGFIVFRVLVRRDYRHRGYLTPLTSFLELVIWLLFVCFPDIYNPPDWWLVCFANTPVSPVHKIIGSTLVAVGMAVALIAMAGLGVRTTMGDKVQALQQTGLYRVSRNPQLVGGGLAVLGVAVLWPSWYALGWVVLYGVIGHLMVLAEEEHLRSTHGETYVKYCREIPRYIGIPRKSKNATA